MNAEKRRAKIITQIDAGGNVDVSELSSLMNVSEMTIRRDLKTLEKDGIVRRVHGGAVSARGRSYEPPLVLRNAKNSEGKRRIARCASELIMQGDSIALDTGSTTMEIARNLLERQNLTIVTSSLNIASLLVNQVGIRLILPGGFVRAGEASLTGSLTTAGLESLYVDKLFLAVGGIDAQAGLTEFNWDDSLVKKAMIRCAKQVIVVADASKFNNIAFAFVAHFDQVHQLVTDKMPPPDILTELKKANVELLIANE